MTTRSSSSLSLLSLPWVEKYRPKSIGELAGQSSITQSLQAFVQNHPEQLPHLLFYGPPGTGKTSLALALARDLFGPQLYTSRILELNASDERGIAVIREKVKGFAKSVARESVEGYPCPAYKLCILDEADALTTDAQTALRRVIEANSKSTRFILICNYVSRIIEPLASRCSKFRFRPLPTSDGVTRILHISQSEGIQLEAEVAQVLLEKVAEGDLRRAITLLQGIVSTRTPVTVQSVCDFGGVVPDNIVHTALELLINSTQSAVSELAQGTTKYPADSALVLWLLEKVIHQGYSSQQFLNQLIPMIVQCKQIPERSRALIAVKAAQIEKALTDGGDEWIQLSAFCTFAMKLLCPSQHAKRTINVAPQNHLGLDLAFFRQ